MYRFVLSLGLQAECTHYICSEAFIFYAPLDALLRHASFALRDLSLWKSFKRLDNRKDLSRHGHEDRQPREP